MRRDGHVAWRSDAPPADPRALVESVSGERENRAQRSRTGESKKRIERKKMPRRKPAPAPAFPGSRPFPVYLELKTGGGSKRALVQALERAG